MEKQQVFLANDIFDIDSALDRLEENLFTSSDEKSINTESQKQKVAKQQHKDFEENGNTINGGASETLSDDNKRKIAKN